MHITKNYFLISMKNNVIKDTFKEYHDHFGSSFHLVFDITYVETDKYTSRYIYIQMKKIQL